MATPINSYQRIALDAYADGSFSETTTYSFDDSHGDALLSFVMAELSDNEDCEDIDMAIARIESGIRDLQDVLAALQASH